MNADPSSSDDDDVILNLQLWEVILILVVIVLAAIGLCITTGLVSDMTITVQWILLLTLVDQGYMQMCKKETTCCAANKVFQQKNVSSKCC